MKKYIPAVLLAVCLSLAVPTLAAASPASVAEATQVVNALGIMVGDEAGNMGLERGVTRAEFITMAVKATPGGEQVGQAATSPYPDVPWKHWASGYVEAGVAGGLISGYTDGTFRPSNQITLAEGSTIALALLGYGPADFSGAYPTGQLAMYRSLKLDRGVSVSAASAPLSRQDSMYLFYNLMTAKTKGGQAYLTTLGHSLNASGEIDLVALINGAMEGPVVAEGNWQSAIPFPVSQAKVYRNGASVSDAAIQEGDVVYWNKAMKSLWIYRDRVTGTVQALAPSAAAPTSVTVAGRTCQIETSAAAYDLSDLGEFSLGDTVTLLLGRDGAVAAVKGGVPTAGERVGVVTSIENAQYDDGKGGTYTARTVVLLATDGRTYRYEEKSAGREGSLVRVMISDQAGGVTLRSLPSASLTGKVDGAGTKVGNYSFAQDAEILDVSDKNGVRVYPSRLAGMSLSDSHVAYYSLNGSGEIDKMVLKDATGDTYRYGVLTDMTKSSKDGVNVYYTYEFNVDGMAGFIPTTTTGFPVSKGPIRIKGPVKAPEKMYALLSAKTGEVSGNQFVVGSQKYTLWDNLAVYELRDGAYYPTTLSRVKDGNFTLTGWYDKTDVNGGRLRVIVASEKEKT